MFTSFLPQLRGTGKAECILALAIALSPLSAAAWGLEGNLVVAEIAEKHLDPRTKTAIEELLAPEGSHNLADIANWEVAWLGRNPDKEDWFEDKNPLSSNGTFQIDIICKDEQCLSKQLARQMTTLSGASEPAQKREALKFVVAMTAALWQPMNCIDNGDDNGRLVNVIFRAKAGGAQKTTNLHALWDSVFIAEHLDIGEADRMDASVMAEKIRGRLGEIDDSIGILRTARIPNPSRTSGNSITSTMAISIQHASGTCTTFGGPDLPMTLSPYILGRDVAYKGVASPGQTSPSHTVELPADYAETAWPVIRRQLRNAGMDLAIRLNEALVR